MKKTLTILFLFMGFITLSNAQQYDLGGIVQVEAAYKVRRSWSFSLESDVRFHQLFSKYDRFKVEAGANYTFFQKRFKIGASYKYVNKLTDKYLYENRHAILGSFTYSENIRQWKLSYRVQVQSTFRDEKYGDYKFNPKTYLRNRFQVSYSMFNRPLEFYASAEFFLRLYEVQHYFIDEFRTCLGLEYRINQNNYLQFFVRMDNEIQVKEPVNIVYFGVGYKFK